MGIWRRQDHENPTLKITPVLNIEEKHSLNNEIPPSDNVTSQLNAKHTDPMWWLPAVGIASGVVCFILVIGLIIFYRKHCKNDDEDNSQKSLWLSHNLPSITTIKSFSSNRGDTSSNYSSDVGVTSTDSPTNLADYLTSTKIHAEKKQPQLHRYRSSISSSIADGSSKGSEDEDSDGSAENNGKIWFSAKYSFDEKLLYVEVIKAKHLKGRSMFYSPRDPFVRLYLLPDESNYYQTKVRYRTLSPKFKETFTFKMDYEESSSRSLKFVVYDFDKKNVRHSLGQAVVPLATTDLKSGNIINSDLDDLPQKLIYVGEMQISLNCNPYTDKMKVSIMRLKNIPIKSNGKTYNVYIRLDLYHGRLLIKSKSTSLYPISSVIEVHENFTYGISGRHLDSCSLTISVVVRTKDTPCTEDKTIGRLVLGPFLFARGRELLHWQEMLCNPRTSIEKWHHLCDVA